MKKIIYTLTTLSLLQIIPANAQTWIPVPGLQSAVIYSLGVYQGELYAGGNFSISTGNPSDNIAKWNDTAWSAVGIGADGYVMAMAVYNGELYAGGNFTTAGGNPAPGIAKWNGTSWSDVGGGVNNGVTALCVYNGELYVGGNFTTAGGNPANFIAKWNGTSWSPVGAGTSGPFVTAFTVDTINNLLYVGGGFTTAGGNPANNIAIWNGTTWSAIGAGTNGGVYSLCYNTGNIYAGGSFTSAGSISASYIAAWDGAVWSPLSTGMNCSFCGGSEGVFSIISCNGMIYAGGVFDTAGGNPANFISRWNGSFWNYCGSGTNDFITSQVVYNGWLYAAGDSTTSSVGSRIAKMDTATSGIHESTTKNLFTVFPNPSTGKFMLHAGEKIQGELFIANVLGEIIYQSSVASLKQEIDLSSQPEGIYFVQMTGENGKPVTQKIVVQR